LPYTNRERTQMYRVNFGNGQVHPVMSKAAGQRLIAAQFDGGVGCYIQKYMGDGMWIRVRP
jgi:hypothetical protein